MIALPDLLSAAQGAEELGIWSTYRSATVALSDVMSRIEVELDQDYAEQESFFLLRAERELQPIWHQVGSEACDGLAWTHRLGRSFSAADSTTSFGKLAGFLHAQERIGIPPELCLSQRLPLNPLGICSADTV